MRRYIGIIAQLKIHFLLYAKPGVLVGHFLLSDNLILQSLYLEVVCHTENEKKGNHFIFSAGKMYTRGPHIASVVKKKNQVSNEYGLALSLNNFYYRVSRSCILVCTTHSIKNVYIGETPSRK